VHKALKFGANKCCFAAKFSKFSTSTKLEVLLLTYTLHRTTDRELRGVYEAFLGDRIADTTWRAVKKFMTEAGLEINPTNLHEYASLRKRHPKLSLTPLEFRNLLASFDNSKKLLPQSITGQEFIRLLVIQNIKPDLSTIYRWFKQSGMRYNKAASYCGESIAAVVYFAVVWRFVNTKKLQRSHDNV